MIFGIKEVSNLGEESEANVLTAIKDNFFPLEGELFKFHTMHFYSGWIRLIFDVFFNKLQFYRKSDFQNQKFSSKISHLPEQIVS
jgi:hypothetical protein